MTFKPNYDLIEELKWRGLYFDSIPGTEDQLNKEMTTGYIGFDPTAPSLTIGNFVQVVLLMHLQRSGHKPIALMGGATGLIGDPSGKSAERNLLDHDVLQKNLGAQIKQIEKFLDFSDVPNKAEIVNNYDWYKDMNILAFLRDVGKHLTVNYMMAKDSVKSRLETGLSFTEFSYQLIQGYDFKWLFDNKGVRLQMGGSDQWGNIVSGTELIRRMGGEDDKAYAVTTPLLTKADGTKFGKSESGNIWIDRTMTSPYKMYQFFLNASDDDVVKYIKVFSFRSREEIESLIKEHQDAPHTRLLQKTVAEDVVTLIHGEDDYNQSVEASGILFGKDTAEQLKNLDEEMLLAIMDGVPRSEVPKAAIESGINIIDFLSEHTSVFPSKGEARKMLTGGGVSLNKAKVDSVDTLVDSTYLLNNKYILAQKGKKNYYLIVAN